MSMKSRVAAEKSKDKSQKADWDNTTTTSKREEKTAEEKAASYIANEMLKDNQKLRGIHSNVSFKKIIEREAKR
jgi:hypothetical protein